MSENRKSSEVQRATAAVIASINPPPPAELSRPKRSVLLVEDDPPTAKVMTEMLEQLGYSSEWVASGDKVLEMVSSSRFDVIMLNLVMPDIDGFTVLQRLESLMPHLLHRVLITTGMPTKYLEELDRKQICGIVKKPVDVGELQHLLIRCAGDVPFEAGGESPVL